MFLKVAYKPKIANMVMLKSAPFPSVWIYTCFEITSWFVGKGALVAGITGEVCVRLIAGSIDWVMTATVVTVAGAGVLVSIGV